MGLGVGVVCQQLWREVRGWEELVELIAGVPSSGRWVRCPCHLVLFSCQVEVLPWKRKLSEAGWGEPQEILLSLLLTLPFPTHFAPYFPFPSPFPSPFLLLIPAPYSSPISLSPLLFSLSFISTPDPPFRVSWNPDPAGVRQAQCGLTWGQTPALPLDVER